MGVLRMASGRAGTWLLALALVGCGAGSQAPRAAGPRSGSTRGAEDSGALAEAKALGMSPAAARHYLAGLEAFTRGDLDGAEEALARATQVDPRAYRAHHALGATRQRRGSSDGALAAYARALEIEPKHAPSILSKAELLLGLGRLDEAHDFTRTLMAREPDSAAALTAAAEVASARSDSMAAQELARRALKEDPDFRPAMVAIARDHYRARRLELALYTLTAILDGYGAENPPRDKDNADARWLRALILKEQNKRSAAIGELKKVVELRPDMVLARLSLAAYLLEAGNAEEARPLLEGALEYDPSNVLVHLSLGDAYRLLGKPKDALEHLAWVVRKDPKLAQAHYNMGLVYLFSSAIPNTSERRALEQAISAFERYKELVPRAGRAAGDDVDELIARARNKKAILEALGETSEAGMGGEG